MMNESDLGGRIAVVTGGACDIELPKPQRRYHDEIGRHTIAHSPAESWHGS